MHRRSPLEHGSCWFCADKPSGYDVVTLKAGDPEKLWTAELDALAARATAQQQQEAPAEDNAEQQQQQQKAAAPATIVKLLQTHAHIDHVLGLAAAKRK